jgi:hypothetical protein
MCFHPIAIKGAFFSSFDGMCLKTDHLLAHNTSPNKFIKIEIIPCAFSGCNEVKLEVNKRNYRNCTHTWKLNNKAFE